MTALDTASSFTRPRSAAPSDLYNALRALVDQMQRVRSDDAATQKQVEDTAATIGASLQSQIETDQLTPDEAYNLMLDAIAASVFGAAQQSANAAYAAANALHAARLKTALQSYVQTASLNVEQTVRQSEVESLTSQITTLDAALGTTNANITAEATARANGDTANAAAITTVQTQANGNSASIAQIISSDGGTTTNWAVTTNSNGQVKGMVALNGSASGTTFTVVADKFIVAHPTTPGDTIAAFVVGLVNGVSTVGVNGNLLVDGSILARTIAAGAITTNKLAAGAVTATELAAGAVTAGKIAAGSVTATELNVSTLSAIAANLGTVTAGLIRNAADTIRFDLPNMRLYRVDGTMDIDLYNKRIFIES